MPVGKVEQHTDCVGAEVRIDAAGKKVGPQQDDTCHDDEGGEKPPGAPCPEGFERDVTGGTMLVDQDARDQEPREHEEGVHADESPGHQRGAAVETDDERNGQRPYPVERWVVRQLAFGDAALARWLCSPRGGVGVIGSPGLRRPHLEVLMTKELVHVDFWAASSLRT